MASCRHYPSISCFYWLVKKLIGSVRNGSHRYGPHTTDMRLFDLQTVDEKFNSEEQRFKLLELSVRALIQDIALYMDQLEVGDVLS